MKNILSIINNLILGQNKDVILIGVFAIILTMIIIPIPSFFMDVFITINIAMSIIVLILVIHIKSPIEFSTFPAIILVTTLFRLSISISTTRLILTDGEAGAIIETFGEVVVGGNVVVGLVMFLIITVVQFLVITKGADRVAEVGARFTLDGLPGKQMSVDADVRAGTIDQLTAKGLRTTLERESKLFGSMDGAMKFVKGDAVAGLVITAINLIGGMIIGMTQLDMSAGEAATLFSLLTIGDGLVAQIPALLISISAGAMVTRVTNPENVDLGSEISQQLTANARTIAFAGVMIAIFGLVPGFPTAIFFIVGLSMTGAILLKARRQIFERASALTQWDAMYLARQKEWQKMRLSYGAPETLKLVLPISIKTQSVLLFTQNFDNCYIGLSNRIGIPLGYWTFEFEDSPNNEYKIYLQQNLIGEGSLDYDTVFVRMSSTLLNEADIPHVKSFGLEEGALVSTEFLNELVARDIPFIEHNAQLACHLIDVVLEHQHMLANFQTVSNLINSLSRSHPALHEDLRDNLTVNQIRQIIKMLLDERISLENWVRIMEAILQSALQKSDPLDILQHVRLAISDQITRHFAPTKFLPVVVISPTIENYLREGLRHSQDDAYIVIEPELSKLIADQASALLSGGHVRGQDPVLITQQDIRRSVFKVLQKNGVFVPVVSYQELQPDIVVYPIGFVGAKEAA